MLTSSVKEFEILKTEVQSIKDCITKYVEYIIGANGITYFILGTLTHDRNIPLFEHEYLGQIFPSDLILFAAIVVVLAIYYIVNYKFASHNRYVGYLQLLSQEITHQKIKSPIPMSTVGLTYEESDFLSSGPDHIFSWEYVNSKWNNRPPGSQKYPEKQFNKLDFRLQMPNEQLNYFIPELGSEKNSIQLFVENVIWTAFDPLSRKKLYNKFKITSWYYPAYVFWLFSCLLGISMLIFLTTSWLRIELKFVFGCSVFLLWLRFCFDIFRLLKRNQTIDFYCWAFLPHRIRLLNNYKIRPIYHSTSFLRYYKSLQTGSKLRVAEVIDDTTLNKIIRGRRLSKSERNLIKKTPVQ